MYFIISGTKKTKLDIGIGTHSTLGGKIFLPPKIYMINKILEFYMILARKISKMPEFVWYLPKKMNKVLEFYIIFARKLPEFT